MGPRVSEHFRSPQNVRSEFCNHSSPSKKAELLLYIATLGASVSAALVEVRTAEGVLKQVPIYSVFEALDSSKLLYSEMEDGVCHCHGSKKASLLLLELQDQSSNLVPFMGHVREQGDLRQNWQMGYVAGRAHNRLRLQISSQVSGLGRFYRRLDPNKAFAGTAEDRGYMAARM